MYIFRAELVDQGQDRKIDREKEREREGGRDRDHWAQEDGIALEVPGLIVYVERGGGEVLEVPKKRWSPSAERENRRRKANPNPVLAATAQSTKAQ